MSDTPHASIDSSKTELLPDSPATKANIPAQRKAQKNAQIDWNEQGQPSSSEFDDVYFSKTNGLAESRYVFLSGNQLELRFKQLKSRQTFIIGETGFGTGLNFLASWQLWQQCIAYSSHSHNDPQLHFLSVEKFPLSQKDLIRALSLWPELKHLSDPLINQYPPLPASDFRRLVFDGGRVVLTLIFNDATAGFKQCLAIDKPGPHIATQALSVAAKPLKVDAWFLDGFSPAKNPDMWTVPLIKQLAYLSGADSSLATFTAAGHVRRAIQEAGFVVAKRKGFANKREMLTASFNSGKDHLPAIPSDTHQYQASWHLVQKPNIHALNDRIAIIGAGLSGCHSAFALANRGYQVTVIDQGDIAHAASGNAQGVVYIKLSETNDVLARLNNASLHFANQLYQGHNFYAQFGSQCGVFYTPSNSSQAKHYQRIVEHYADTPGFARGVDTQDSEAIIGLKLKTPGILLPQSGWLNPKTLCSALLDHPNIKVLKHTNIHKLRFEQGRWLLFNTADATSGAYDSVIIAGGTECLNLDQTRYLPLKAIRGQISSTKANEKSKKLKTVLCGGSYIAPSIDSYHWLGASFNLGDMNPHIDDKDHRTNLKKTNELCSEFNFNKVNEGRVGFRATTPDYLPIVGPIAQPEPFIDTFSKYRVNSKAKIDAPGHYYPNLYVHTGLGSRGLAYAPLGAELLACMISGEPLPLPRELMLHLHPARFLVRDLSRGRL